MTGVDSYTPFDIIESCVNLRARLRRLIYLKLLESK